jgi:hypothetical protein
MGVCDEVLFPMFCFEANRSQFSCGDILQILGDSTSYYVGIGEDKSTNRFNVQKTNGKGDYASGDIFSVEEDELVLG